jgi:hypothetical protein
MFVQTTATIQMFVFAALYCVFHDQGANAAFEELLLRVITFNEEAVWVATFFEKIG